MTNAKGLNFYFGANMAQTNALNPETRHKRTQFDTETSVSSHQKLQKRPTLRVFLFFGYEFLTTLRPTKKEKKPTVSQRNEKLPLRPQYPLQIATD
jgi:hypothetical protein